MFWVAARRRLHTAWIVTPALPVQVLVQVLVLVLVLVLGAVVSRKLVVPLDVVVDVLVVSGSVPVGGEVSLLLVVVSVVVGKQSPPSKKHSGTFNDSSHTSLPQSVTAAVPVRIASQAL